MDRARTEAFLDRFVDLASGATTIGLLAVADRSGLLVYLGEGHSGTSDQIAEGAGLDPRYVREILSGLAAAGWWATTTARRSSHWLPSTRCS